MSRRREISLIEAATVIFSITDDNAVTKTYLFPGGDEVADFAVYLTKEGHALATGHTGFTLTWTAQEQVGGGSWLAVKAGTNFTQADANPTTRRVDNFDATTGAPLITGINRRVTMTFTPTGTRTAGTTTFTGNLVVVQRDV